MTKLSIVKANGKFTVQALTVQAHDGLSFSECSALSGCWIRNLRTFKTLDEAKAFARKR